MWVVGTVKPNVEVTGYKNWFLVSGDVLEDDSQFVEKYRLLALSKFRK